MAVEIKRVFISYSWAVQERVIELAERLIANGIDVVLDVYDLKDGYDKYAFMEQSVNDESIDHVLIICDKTYTEKANSRSGGVGDETVIITPQIYQNVKQEKFIPVIFEKDIDGRAYCPHYIRSRIYIDLSDDNNYESEYEKLLRDIYQKPLHKKPALGLKPAWLENEDLDFSALRDTIKQIKGYNGSNTTKADFLIRKMSDEIIKIVCQFTVNPDKPIEKEFVTAFDKTKVFRDIYVDYCEALIYNDFDIASILSELFETLYNNLHDSQLRNNPSSINYELSDLIIYELFICTAAILLHYGKYRDLYGILVHPYFLRINENNPTIEPHSYAVFRKYFSTLENVCKPVHSEPKLLTLTGEIITNREKKPVLTKESISNADLVLYQLYSIINVPSTEYFDYWFPDTYIYHRFKQAIWQKLQSKEYCTKISPLFGVNTIEEIKTLVKDSFPDRRFRHDGAFEAAPGILSSIALDDIGTLN